jgi:hypothetical protein
MVLCIPGGDYKDPTQSIEARIDAANKAIHFERPALATAESSSILRLVNHVTDQPMFQEEWAQRNLTAH